jgi:hypothetical protein
MKDDHDVLDFGRNPHLAGVAARQPKETAKDHDAAEEESCAAFGFLRGIRDRALAIEFRFRTGNSEWYAYHLLSMWQYNPSCGILMKFTGGDVVTLVLIRGSNLDGQLSQHSVNLTDRGLQRNRITFIREMDEDELRKAGKDQPTIDRIEVGEFETVEEQREWLKKNAPAFLRALPGR